MDSTELIPLKQQNPQIESNNEQQIVTVPAQEKLYDHRFQRTDQWKPVYTWLESLNTDEVISSQDVVDWLNSNPDIRDDLYGRHSRYHLTHYIKKCHVKILKRKEKLGLIIAKLPPSRGDQSAEMKNSASPHFTGNSTSSARKDSDLYKAKQIEALRKYEILLEFEKQLAPVFGNREHSEDILNPLV